MLVGQALDAIRLHIERLEYDLAEADAMIATHAHKIDPNPRESWPKGNALERAVFRHQHRVVDEAIRKSMGR